MSNLNFFPTEQSRELGEVSTPAWPRQLSICPAFGHNHHHQVDQQVAITCYPSQESIYSRPERAFGRRTLILKLAFSPGPLEVWLSNKEEISGTMFSHIFGRNQNCPNLLSRWNWKHLSDLIISEIAESQKNYLLGSCYSFLANNKTGLVRQWERRIRLQSRYHRCHKIPPGWILY